MDCGSANAIGVLRSRHLFRDGGVFDSELSRHFG